MHNRYGNGHPAYRSWSGIYIVRFRFYISSFEECYLILTLWTYSHDAASVPAFGTLALAVIFDPLADSGRIDGTPSHIAHRQARHILNALSCSQFSGCFQDIAPSVANKYGAKRITSICNSYFANPRYISRCYTGLGLCAAMASAKSLHPSFINEGKVHLTILRWFWKTFGEPQESHPDDKEYDDGKHDLKLLPGDSLSCLWTCVPTFNDFLLLS